MVEPLEHHCDFGLAYLKPVLLGYISQFVFLFKKLLTERVLLWFPLQQMISEDFITSYLVTREKEFQETLGEVLWSSNPLRPGKREQRAGTRVF